MTQDEVQDLLIKITSVEVDTKDFDEFIENSWSKSHHRLCEGAYDIGYADGFNKGLQIAKKILSRYYGD